MSINTLAHVFTPHGNIVYTANDFRQTVRIAVAGTIALSISTFYDVQYGVFFVVYPLMLMSLVPMFNLHVARQFIFSAAVNCVEMVLIVGYLSQWPVIMTLVVFALYVMRFRFMSQGPLFLLGSMGVVCQSTMLNFMSYPTSNWHTLMFSNMEACVMAVALSALLHYLIPDVEPRKPPPRIEKDAARIRHELGQGHVELAADLRSQRLAVGADGRDPDPVPDALSRGGDQLDLARRRGGAGLSLYTGGAADYL